MKGTFSIQSSLLKYHLLLGIPISFGQSVGRVYSGEGTFKKWKKVLYSRTYGECFRPTNLCLILYFHQKQLYGTSRHSKYKELLRALNRNFRGPTPKSVRGHSTVRCKVYLWFLCLRFISDYPSDMNICIRSLPFPTLTILHLVRSKLWKM